METKRPFTAAEFLARMTGAAQERNQAQAALAGANNLLTACGAFLGLSLADLSAKKPEELTAALAAKVGASQAEANAEAVKTATAAQTAAETRATTAAALTQVYVAGLAAAKVTVTAADADKGVQPADVTAALNARVNLLAGEKLAELGFPASGIPVSSADADAPADFAGKLKHFASLSGAERDEYYRREIAPEFARRPGVN